MCIRSGYKTLTPIEVGNVLMAHRRKEISFRALRVWFACVELLTIRAAARRSTPFKRKGSTPCYRLDELQRLTGLSARSVRAELGILRKRELLDFRSSEIRIQSTPVRTTLEEIAPLCGRRSPRRPIPFPRSVVRFIATARQKSLGLVTIGYMLRGLTIDRVGEEVRGAGTVKASWLARHMGVSLRAVRGARKQLISHGLITKDETSFQRKLNRDGAYFRVNFDWTPPMIVGRKALIVTGSDAPNSAPPVPNSCAESAPLLRDLKSPNGSKNQKARLSSGFQKVKREGGPSITNVREEDLSSIPRTEALYEQACSSGILRASEAARLNFFAAAVRARRCGGRDPVRVFMGIVRRGLWHHITNEDEARACAVLTRSQGSKNLDGTLPAQIGTIVFGRNEKRGSGVLVPLRSLVTIV